MLQADTAGADHAKAQLLLGHRGGHEAGEPKCAAEHGAGDRSPQSINEAGSPQTRRISWWERRHQPF
eukprot:2176352-Prymnesium_polylepis.1